MKTERSPRNPQEMIDRIRGLMEERRFNRSSFAQALGYARQWGYVFMDNQILISVPLLRKIAKVLGVTTTSLLPDEDAKETFEEVVRKIAREEIEKVIKTQP